MTKVPLLNLLTLSGIAIIIITGIGYVGFMLWRDTEKSENPTDEIVSEESAKKVGPKDEVPLEKLPTVPDLHISDWSIYRSEKFGYELQYPADWRRETWSDTDDIFSVVFDGPLQEYGADFNLDNIRIRIDFASNDKELPLNEWLQLRDTEFQCEGWNWDWNKNTVRFGTDPFKKTVTHDNLQGIRREEICRGSVRPLVRYYFPLEERKAVLIFTMGIAHPEPLVRARYLLLAESVYERFLMKNSSHNTPF